MEEREKWIEKLKNKPGALLGEYCNPSLLNPCKGQGIPGSTVTCENNTCKAENSIVKNIEGMTGSPADDGGKIENLEDMILNA